MSLYDQALAAGAPAIGGFTPGQALTPEQILQLRAQSPHTPVGDMVYHPGWETPSLTDAGETGISRVGDEFVKKLPGNNIAVWNADGTYRGSTADGKITFKEAATYVALLAGGAYAINGAAGAAGAAGASNAGAGAVGLDFGAAAEAGTLAGSEAGLGGFGGLEAGSLIDAAAGDLGQTMVGESVLTSGGAPAISTTLGELGAEAAGFTVPTFDPSSSGPLDPTNYSNEGRNYPTPNDTQGPGGSPVNAPLDPSKTGNTVIPPVNGNNGTQLPTNLDPSKISDWTSLFNVLSGLYGLKLAGDAAEKSDPFGPYRKGYADKLLALEANPGLIKSTPGFLSGQDAITRQMAAKGYLGSGNQAGALMRFSGDFYNNEANRLATLAGSNINPNQTYFNQAQLVGQSLSNIGYGLSPYMQGGPR